MDHHGLAISSHELGQHEPGLLDALHQQPRVWLTSAEDMVRFCYMLVCNHANYLLIPQTFVLPDV